MPTKAKETVPGFDKSTIEAVQQGAEKTVDMSKDNMEAWMQSMTATAKGFEKLSGENLEFAKHTMDESIKASKAMMSAKTMQEFITLQTDFTRSMFDQFVNQATKINDMTMSMAKDSYAPINDRVTAFAELMQKARAA